MCLFLYLSVCIDNFVPRFCVSSQHKRLPMSVVPSCLLQQYSLLNSVTRDYASQAWITSLPTQLQHHYIELSHHSTSRQSLHKCKEFHNHMTDRSRGNSCGGAVCRALCRRSALSFNTLCRRSTFYSHAFFTHASCTLQNIFYACKFASW